MNTITVIGKNSKLYKSLDISNLKKNFNIVELSHAEVNDLETVENPIIFSFSNDIKQNDVFLEMISSKRIGKIIYISSIAAEVYERFGFYKYPEIKYSGEKKIFPLQDSVLLRIGIVESFHDIYNSFYGTVKLTTNKLIVTLIHDILMIPDNRKIINCWQETFIDGKKLYSMIFFFQKKIFKFSPFVFFMFRPFLILYRFIGYKNYGYTFISNNLK